MLEHPSVLQPNSVIQADKMSGFLHKNVALFSLSSPKAAGWFIFKVDWEHRVALSSSAHSKEIVSSLAGYGFASISVGTEGTWNDKCWQQMMSNVPVESGYVTERRKITTDVTESVDVLPKPAYTWNTQRLTL